MCIIYITSIIILIIVFFSTIPFKTILDNNMSVWKVNSNSIYLTFDDGPNRKITPFILDELKKHKQKATFFLIPEYIKKENEFIVKRIFLEGHAVGLHGRSRWLSFQSIKYLDKYIKNFNQKISGIIDEKYQAKLFRPPSLWRSPWLYFVLNRYNIKLVGVSPFCWLDQWTKDVEIVTKRFSKYLKNGLIFVLHDGIANEFEPNMKTQKKAIIEILSILTSTDTSSNAL